MNEFSDGTIFDSPDELFQIAQERGLIELNTAQNISENIIQIFARIQIKDPDGWHDFLTDIIEKTQNEGEKDFVSNLLNMFISQTGWTKQSPITDENVKKLQKIDTIDDFLKEFGEIKEDRWPKTMDLAIKILLKEMKDKDRESIKQMKEDELIRLHRSFGRYIRNKFGLWAGNKKLLTSCNKTHPDEASFVIIKALWNQLKKPIL